MATATDKKTTPGGDDNVNRAREHVAKLAREIESLADAGGPSATFFSEFLSRLVTVLGAEAGVVWLRDASNRIQLECEVNLATTGFYQQAESRKINESILGDMLETGEARIRSKDDEDAKLPTAHVLLLASLQRGKEIVGVVQIFQRPDSPRDARPGYLQFMEQMCGHASRFLENQEAAKKQISPLEFWKQFEQFMMRLQRSLNITEVANTSANDGRQIIQCDRVSVVLKRGVKTAALAVSGADSVNRRANTVRLLEKLSDRVISAGEPLTYTGQIEKLAPQIEKPLGDYLHESNARLVHIVPLFPPERLIVPGQEKEKPLAKSKSSKKAFGALVVEQMSESRPKPGLMDRAELVADHAGAALHNAVTHESLFLLPVWRFLGDSLEALRGRTLVKVVSVFVAIIVIVIAMVFIPWEYRVEAKGRLMPSIQRDVFATWDGEIIAIYVKSGDRVKEGQPLIQLRNEDLSTKLLAAEREVTDKYGEEAVFVKEKASLSRNPDREKETELDGKIGQKRIEIEGAKKMVAMLKEQTERLTIRAPIDGVVATFQVEQFLRNRPVGRGEKLLEVMDETGDWRLELEVPENRVGHVLRRQQKLQIPEHPVDFPELQVEFLPATTTEETFTGTLYKLADKSSITPEQGSILEGLVRIPNEEINKLKDKDNLRIGAEVKAKIGCGDRSLGYVLFGDVVEFIQKYVMLW